MLENTRIPRRKTKPLFLLVSVTLVAVGLATEVLLDRPVHAQIAVQNQGYLPFSDAPIFYRTAPVNDPVAKLQKQIDRGEVTLTYEPQFGYLKSLLEKLAIPAVS